MIKLPRRSCFVSASRVSSFCGGVGSSGVFFCGASHDQQKQQWRRAGRLPLPTSPPLRPQHLHIQRRTVSSTSSPSTGTTKKPNMDQIDWTPMTKDKTVEQVSRTFNEAFLSPQSGGGGFFPDEKTRNQFLPGMRRAYNAKLLDALQIPTETRKKLADPWYLPSRSEIVDTFFPNYLNVSSSSSLSSSTSTCFPPAEMIAAVRAQSESSNLMKQSSLSSPSSSSSSSPYSFQSRANLNAQTLEDFVEDLKNEEKFGTVKNDRPPSSPDSQKWWTSPEVIKSRSFEENYYLFYGQLATFSPLFAFCEEHNIYEIWTQEYIDELINYLEAQMVSLPHHNSRHNKRKQSGDDCDGSGTFKIIEVGAGNGRLTHFINERSNGRIPKVIATDDHSWGLGGGGSSSSTSASDNTKRGALSASSMIQQEQQQQEESDNSRVVVEKQSAEDAVDRYRPNIVLCSWMPENTDLTAAFRRRRQKPRHHDHDDGDNGWNGIDEYILIGPADSGVCGLPWETWGYTPPAEDCAELIRLKHQQPQYLEHLRQVDPKQYRTIESLIKGAEARAVGCHDVPTPPPYAVAPTSTVPDVGNSGSSGFNSGFVRRRLDTMSGFQLCRKDYLKTTKQTNVESEKAVEKDIQRDKVFGWGHSETWSFSRERR